MSQQANNNNAGNNTSNNNNNNVNNHNHNHNNNNSNNNNNASVQPVQKQKKKAASSGQPQPHSSLSAIKTTVRDCFLGDLQAQLTNDGPSDGANLAAGVMHVRRINIPGKQHSSLAGVLIVCAKTGASWYYYEPLSPHQQYHQGNITTVNDALSAAYGLSVTASNNFGFKDARDAGYDDPQIFEALEQMKANSSTDYGKLDVLTHLEESKAIPFKRHQAVQARQQQQQAPPSQQQQQQQQTISKGKQPSSSSSSSSSSSNWTLGGVRDVIQQELQKGDDQSSLRAYVNKTAQSNNSHSHLVFISAITQQARAANFPAGKPLDQGQSQIWNEILLASQFDPVPK